MGTSNGDQAIKLPGNRPQKRTVAVPAVSSIPEEKRLYEMMQKKQDAMEVKSDATQALKETKKSLTGLVRDERDVKRRLNRDDERIDRLKANIAKAKISKIDTTVLENELGEATSSKKSNEKNLKELTAQLRTARKTIEDKNKLITKETNVLKTLEKSEKKQRTVVTNKKSAMIKKELAARNAKAKKDAEQKRVAIKKANEKRAAEDKKQRLAAKKEADSKRLAKEKAAKESKLAYTRLKETEKALKDRKAYFERASKSYGDNVKFADINKKAIAKNKSDIETYEKLLQQNKRLYEETKLREKMSN